MQVAAASLWFGLDALRREPLPRVVGAVWQHEARRLWHLPGVDRDGVSQQWPLLGGHDRAREDLVVHCRSRSSHSRSLR